MPDTVLTDADHVGSFDAFEEAKAIAFTNIDEMIANLMSLSKRTQTAPCWLQIAFYLEISTDSVDLIKKQIRDFLEIRNFRGRKRHPKSPIGHYHLKTYEHYNSSHRYYPKYSLGKSQIQLRIIIALYK